MAQALRMVDGSEGKDLCLARSDSEFSKVSTALGGIPKIIVTDKLGVLVDRDEVSLASGLERALDRQWDKEAIGQYAAQYSWDRAARSLGRLFHSITRAPTARRRESVPVS